MKIIPYDDTYRDDMIFMVLQAKDALGRRPHLNDDLLSVEDSYLRTGDMFWLAIDEQDNPIEVPPFTPQTDAEKREYEAALERRRIRLQR